MPKSPSSTLITTHQHHLLVNLQIDMIPSNEIREVHCLVPRDFIIQNLDVKSLPGKSPHHQEFNVVVVSGSTSDEAAEKKQRRVVSNRESARRSRMRKKRQMDELTRLVDRLRTQNQDLVQRLKQALESHDRVLQENVKLKEEASHLRQMVKDLQYDSSFAIASADFDEPPCNFY